jgi:hypothetical protein
LLECCDLDLRRRLDRDVQDPQSDSALSEVDESVGDLQPGMADAMDADDRDRVTRTNTFGQRRQRGPATFPASAR